MELSLADLIRDQPWRIWRREDKEYSQVSDQPKLLTEAQNMGWGWVGGGGVFKADLKDLHRSLSFLFK